MNKPIGGRGKKAPYKTTHVRIPIDLKSKVEELVENFRENNFSVTVENSNKIIKTSKADNTKFFQEMIQAFKDNNLKVIEMNSKNADNNFSITLEQSIELANELLATRITKKELVNKLLTALYQVEVKL